MVMGGLLPAASSQGASAFGQSPDNQTWPAADRPLCPVGTAERTFTSEWSSDSSRPKLVLDYPAAQLDPDESLPLRDEQPTGEFLCTDTKATDAEQHRGGRFDDTSSERIGVQLVRSAVRDASADAARTSCRPAGRRHPVSDGSEAKTRDDFVTVDLISCELVHFSR
jgi:hypothetical protein